MDIDWRRHAKMRGKAKDDSAAYGWRQEHASPSPGPYPAPAPLQAVAAVLGLLGAGGVVLSLLVLEAAIAVIRHNTAAVAVNPRDVAQVALTDFPPLTAVVILICAVLSLALAAMVVGRRRWRWRVAGLGVGVAALLDACMIVSLATALGPGPVQPAYTNPAPVLHPDHFIQSGAIGQPTPGQPDHPATIDRLLADGAATYLQYHIADVAHDGQPTPLLIDDHGRVYQVNVVPTVYTTPAGFMRELMPWRAPVQELAAFPPLAPGVRAVTVRFQDNILRVVQTVHLILNRPLPAIPSLTRVVRLPGIAMTLHFTRGAT